MLRRRQVILLRKYVLGIGRTDIVTGAETEKVWCGVMRRLNFLAEMREVGTRARNRKGKSNVPQMFLIMFLSRHRGFHFRSPQSELIDRL